MNQLTESLFGEICRIQAIDVHSHVRQRQPSAAGLRELLTYHYYTELAYSCGLPKSDVADTLPDAEAIPALVAAMDDFSNTAQYGWFIDLARRLFGFRERHLTSENWAPLAETVARKVAVLGWPDEVRHAGAIEKIFLTNSLDEDLDGFDRAVFVPCLRCDDLVFNLARQSVRDALAKRTGVTVTDTRSLKQAVAEVFRYFAGHDAKSAAISLPPDFVCRPVSDAAAEPLLAKALRGDETSADEQALLRAYIFYLLAEHCRLSRLPMQLMIGVVRNAYQHGVKMGTDLVSNQGSLGQYVDLFNRFHDVTFAVSCLSPNLSHELLTYTWIFQNVRASGHWWYSNVPALIEADLRARIEALPRTKLLGYYSDAYYIEFTLPKFNMYRWCLARVLADQIAMKRFTDQEALDVAACLLRRNAIEVFNL